MNAQSLESYTAVAISSCHISQGDIDILQAQGDSPAENMVSNRGTGFFIKLYQFDDPAEALNVHLEMMPWLTSGLINIIQLALKRGAGLIEIDSGAPDYPDVLPVYDQEDE